MDLIFLAGVSMVVFLPLWWICYPEIIKDCLMFREEAWFGVVIWLCHGWVLFAVYYLVTK